MISDELEKTLQRTQKYAKSLKHQYMTLEHLLFSMLDDEDVLINKLVELRFDALCAWGG